MYTATTLSPANTYPSHADAINAHCSRPYGLVNPEEVLQREAWELEVIPAVVLQKARSLAEEEGMTSLRASGVPPPGGESCTLTRQDLQRAWRKDIVARLRAPLVYPHHSLRFRFLEGCESDSVVRLLPNGEELVVDPESPSPRATQIAVLIRRLVMTHTKLCNEHPACMDAPYDPTTHFEVLLGHSVVCQGYPGLEEEQPDVTFGYRLDRDGVLERCSPEGGAAAGVARTFRVVCCYGATHVNVGCGLYFYRLRVLDPATRDLVDVETLARQLELLRADAARRETDLLQLPLSEEVRDDLYGFQALLTRLSVVPDETAAEVHRRLREASPVNAATLDTLESGLMTVVLGEPTRPALRVSGAQWLHSALSLYASWAVGGEVELRAHATLASMATLQRFVRRALGVRAGEGRPTPGRGTEPLPASSTSGGDTTTTAAAAGADHLELWLPEKHRWFLRPYPPAVPTPVWQPLVTGGRPGLDLGDLCLTLIRCLQRVGGGLGRPRLVFATHQPHGLAPSVVSLMSAEVENYMQVACTSSLLLTRAVREASLRTARQRIAAQLQEAVTCPYPLSRIASEQWEATEPVPLADLCVYAHLLESPEWSGDPGRPGPWGSGGSHAGAAPRASAPLDGPASIQILQCDSDLGIPARLHVRCTAFQKGPQKEPRMADGRVAVAELGVTAESASLGAAVCAVFGELSAHFA